MDVGRDYTEYWHHQQQIRDAVGAPALVEPRWLAPVIALGVRSLPRALLGVPRPDGTAVRLIVDGAAGGRWLVRHEGDGWTIRTDEPAQANATVRLEAAAAARRWYSGRDRHPAGASAAVDGDRGLCEAVLAARAVMV